MRDWQITTVGGLEIPGLIILGLGVIVGVIWSWYALDPSLSKRFRTLLVVLRFLVLVCGLVLVLQPVISLRTYSRTPSEVAFVLDTSASMKIGETNSRFNLSKSIVDASASAMDKLRKGHSVSWFHFAERLANVDEPFVDVDLGRATDIRGALETLIELPRSIPLDGIVLISDGADSQTVKGANGEIDLGWAGEFSVPINTVFINGGDQRKDLAIERVNADTFAFSRSETPIEVALRCVGIEDREVDVFLYQDGSVVQKKTGQLVDGRGLVTFQVTPSVLGRHVMTVTVEELEEDEIAQNNFAHVSFEVIRDKFRVLHLAGRPSWDTRFLRQLFSSMVRVDLVSFYVLRTAYQSETNGSAGMSLIPFPTEELFEGHLDEFDVVVFHGFDPSVVGVQGYLDEIAKFVEDGGAFVAIAGDNGLPGEGLVDERFSAILPVVLLGSSNQKNRLVDESPFRPLLTEAGKRHPVTRLTDTEGARAETWRRLEPLDGVGRVARLAKGAVGLAIHPYVKVDDGAAPVVAVRDVERGRTMALLSDSTWRWRFSGALKGGSDEAYSRFWRNAIAWLTRDPELDRLRVEVIPSVVPKDENIEFLVELLDEEYRPVPGAFVDARVEWLGETGEKEDDVFELRLDEDGRFRRQWLPRGTGPHQIEVTVRESKMKADRRFLVDESDRELGFLQPDQSLLVALSEQTGGAHLLGRIDPSKLKFKGSGGLEVKARRDITLWNLPIVIGFFMCLLFLEWFLRRRTGLL